MFCELYVIHKTEHIPDLFFCKLYTASESHIMFIEYSCTTLPYCLLFFSFHYLHWHWNVYSDNEGILFYSGEESAGV